MNDLAMTNLPGTAKKATSVVVVEDDPASADVLQRRLQANGMKVAVGRDGGQGLALVREIIPDLVLLDVMLPDTDGYDVCLRIKSDGAIAHIPVIFLSARGEVVDKVRGLSCGAADYVTKPWNAAELLARIDAVLLQTRNARPPRLEPMVARPQRIRPLAAVLMRWFRRWDRSTADGVTHFVANSQAVADRIRDRFEQGVRQSWRHREEHDLAGRSGQYGSDLLHQASWRGRLQRGRGRGQRARGHQWPYVGVLVRGGCRQRHPGSVGWLHVVDHLARQLTVSH